MRLLIAIPIAVLVATSVACDRPSAEERSLGEEHARERAELERQQSQERRELAALQAAERSREAASALHQLDEHTAEARAEQAEAAEATAQLGALVATACAGVAEEVQTVCPIGSGEVSEVRESEDGVTLRLRPTVGSVEAMETRLECYRAHRTTVVPAGAPRVASADRECLLDLPGVETDVEEDDGNLFLEVTADEDAAVGRLRSRARELHSQASR
jgi:hypothetical protein